MVASLLSAKPDRRSGGRRVPRSSPCLAPSTSRRIACRGSERARHPRCEQRAHPTAVDRHLVACLLAFVRNIYSARFGPNPAIPLCDERGTWPWCDPLVTLNAEQSMRIAVAFARAVTKVASGRPVRRVRRGVGRVGCRHHRDGWRAIRATLRVESTDGSARRSAVHDGCRSVPGRVPAPGNRCTRRRSGAAAVSRWPAFVDSGARCRNRIGFCLPTGLEWCENRRDDAVPRSRGRTQRPASTTTASPWPQVLTETVLSLQDAAPEGVLAEGLQEVVAYRAEVHQASGMVSIQLKIPVAEALVRIRAHAFAHDRPVGVVAADIVARRLRLDG